MGLPLADAGSKPARLTQGESPILTEPTFRCPCSPFRRFVGANRKISGLKAGIKISLYVQGECGRKRQYRDISCTKGRIAWDGLSILLSCPMMLFLCYVHSDKETHNPSDDVIPTSPLRFCRRQNIRHLKVQSPSVLISSSPQLAYGNTL